MKTVTDHEEETEMQRLAFAAFATASMLVAAPVLAQSAPEPTAPVVVPTPQTATPASDGGCASKRQYTS